MRTFDGYYNGVNLGGWLSQFESYDTAHFESFITEDDLRRISLAGFDHVRVPVDYCVLEDEDGSRKETGYDYLDKCLRWCIQYGLNMLIDLHECYGYSFDPLKKDDKRKFFYDPDLQERYLKLWEQIATHFRDHSSHVAFGALNEVVYADVTDPWNDLIARFIRRVRPIVPDVWLVFGGVCYNSAQQIVSLNIPADERTVYEFHCYEPMIFTHQGAYWVDGMPADFRIGYPRTRAEYLEIEASLGLMLGEGIHLDDIRDPGNGFFDDCFSTAIKKAEADNVPLYCGEYGVIDLAEHEDTLQWYKEIREAFQKHGIGHALWNYKGLSFESWAE